MSDIFLSVRTILILNGYSKKVPLSHRLDAEIFPNVTSRAQRINRSRIIVARSRVRYSLVNYSRAAIGYRIINPLSTDNVVSNRLVSALTSQSDAADRDDISRRASPPRSQTSPAVAARFTPLIFPRARRRVFKESHTVGDRLLKFHGEPQFSNRVFLRDATTKVAQHRATNAANSPGPPPKDIRRKRVVQRIVCIYAPIVKPSYVGGRNFAGGGG